MAKILSKSGASLADVYDVEGSIAGIDQLETKDVILMHEMGSAIFSERLNGAIQRFSVVSIPQSTNFDVTVTQLSEVPHRVHNVIVFANAQSRVALAQVSLLARDLLREIPIFAWDSGFDQEVSTRMIDGTVATFILLRPTGGFFPGTPSLLGGQNLEVVNGFSLRGSTLAFGAGTVTVTGLVYTSFASLGGVSSNGLPLPSW